MTPEELFDELHARAERESHVLLQQVGAIRADSLNTFSWPTGARIVQAMRPLAQEFDDQITRAAYNVGLRVRRGRFQCPVCSNPDCPDAIFVPEGFQLYGGKSANYISNFFG